MPSERSSLNPEIENALAQHQENLESVLLKEVQLRESMILIESIYIRAMRLLGYDMSNFPERGNMNIIAEENPKNIDLPIKTKKGKSTLRLTERVQKFSNGNFYNVGAAIELLSGKSNSELFFMTPTTLRGVYSRSKGNHEFDFEKTENDAFAVFAIMDEIASHHIIPDKTAEKINLDIF